MVEGPSDDTYPLYSRDGTRFVFERRVVNEPARVMVANADGSDAIAIADIPGESWSWDWSPDDKQLLVVWAVDGMPVLSILTTDGSQPARTVDLGDVRPFDYAEWGPPDGHEIIFKGFRPDDTRSFFAVAPDGTGLRQIGDSTTDPHALQGPTLSPDGTTLAYWDDVDGSTYGSYLHKRDLATGVDTAWVLDPGHTGAGRHPRYTPDGSSLLFESAPLDGAHGRSGHPGAARRQCVGQARSGLPTLDLSRSCSRPTADTSLRIAG